MSDAAWPPPAGAPAGAPWTAPSGPAPGPASAPPAGANPAAGLYPGRYPGASTILPAGSAPPAAQPYAAAGAGSPYAPTGYAYPGGSWAGPPPPRRRRWPWILVAGTVGVIVLAVVAAVATAFTVVVQPAHRAAGRYLAALDRRDYAGAYSLLCPADQASVGESTFAADEASDPLVSYSVKTVLIHYRSGQPDTAAVLVDDNHLYTGSRTLVDVPEVKSGSTWMVCHSGSPVAWLPQPSAGGTGASGS